MRTESGFEHKAVGRLRKRTEEKAVKHAAKRVGSGRVEGAWRRAMKRQSHDGASIQRPKEETSNKQRIKQMKKGKRWRRALRQRRWQPQDSAVNFCTAAQ